MKTVGEVMATDVVWVSPSARIKTAVILMKGHNIGALPVVQNNEQVLGIVTYQDVLGQPNEAPLADVMTRDFTAVSPSTSVLEAAEAMTEARCEHLLVMENNRLRGIISHANLLPELGKTFDPLTGLAWSDQFREWAIAALKRGQEISVIFFDLDKYGQFNKKHGHVVGDRVLIEVADVFKRSIETDRDFACRYGGDEFVVVSIRNRDDAIALAEQIKRGIAEIRITEVDNGVSGSYGIAGGRRTIERREIHFAATIDDLVTRASKNCIVSKPDREDEPRTTAPVPQQTVAAEAPAADAPEPAPAAPERITKPARLKIQTVTFSTSGAEASVSVTLARGDEEYSRESSGYIVETTNMLRIVAEAAAGAASKALASEHGVVVEDVLLQTDVRGEPVVTAITAFITPRYTTRTAGSAVIRRGDQFRAAAAAVLASVNRQMEVAPVRDEEETDE